MEIKITNAKVNYHRNGVGGWPFYLVTFDWKDDDGKDRKMLATVPCTTESGDKLTREDRVLSVLDIGLLASGGDPTDPYSNHWRGDKFADEVWNAIDNLA